MSLLNESRTGSTHDDWETPEHVLELVRTVFGKQIGFDPCTTGFNPTKAYTWIAPPADGLALQWSFDWFCNPRYGRALKLWSAKMAEQGDIYQGIGLVPCRPDTKWYDVLATRADAIAEVRGRLKFRGYSEKAGRIIDDVPAQFPSALFYFGGQADKFCSVFSAIARCREVL